LTGDAEAEADLAAMAEDKADPIFKNFKKRISLSPTQVLRYEMDGQPLWMSQKFQPNYVPPCDTCGCERVFECQVI
jgi:Programmed cell death protein 2, C-terminal putative domain